MTRLPLCLACIVLVIFIFAGCHKFPDLVMTGANSPVAERCGECHMTIYEEWKNSFHAKSYINPEFKAVTNDYDFDFCFGCHIPETIYAEQDIKPRNVNLDDGVNCNGCHLNEDCALSGPLSALAPHTVEAKAEFYRSSDLCGVCHKGTFKEWKGVKTKDKKKSCQECHMPSVERKLIQDEPWQKIYPEKNGRKHTFSVHDAITGMNEFLDIEFKDVSYSDKQVKGVLLLENSAVPHSVPTGDYGYREILLTIQLNDDSGNMLISKELSFFVELDNALEYGKKIKIPFSFDLQTIVLKPSILAAKLARTNFNRTLSYIIGEKRVTIEIGG